MVPGGGKAGRRRLLPASMGLALPGESAAPGLEAPLEGRLGAWGGSCRAGGAQRRQERLAGLLSLLALRGKAAGVPSTALQGCEQGGAVRRGAHAASRKAGKWPHSNTARASACLTCAARRRASLPGCCRRCRLRSSRAVWTLPGGTGPGPAAALGQPAAGPPLVRRPWAWREPLGS
jgi:hypothetical protein